MVLSGAQKQVGLMQALLIYTTKRRQKRKDRPLFCNAVERTIGLRAKSYQLRCFRSGVFELQFPAAGFAAKELSTFYILTCEAITAFENQSSYEYGSIVQMVSDLRSLYFLRVAPVNIYRNTNNNHTGIEFCLGNFPFRILRHH